MVDPKQLKEILDYANHDDLDIFDGIDPHEDLYHIGYHHENDGSDDGDHRRLKHLAEYLPLGAE